MLLGCNKPSEYAVIARQPAIMPDYRGVTIPVNIAPLHFSMADTANAYYIEITGQGGISVRVNSSDGKFKIPAKQWSKLLSINVGHDIQFVIYKKDPSGWKKFEPFPVHISADSISPYIAYRLIDPGNIFWAHMGIYQRCLGNFKESAIFTNNLTKNNCVNCHAFANYNPQKMQLHFRRDYGGTLLCNAGNFTFLNTKTPETISNATYPAWHPSGKYIAYSVNKILQSFFAQPGHTEMVFDTISDIVLYNVQTNSISTCPQLTTAKMENMPAWSPDGRYLYYITAEKIDISEYKNQKYDLLRIAFDPLNARWGKVDTLLSGTRAGKSFSFPSVSPDGRFLLFCESDYGYFTIHHPEAQINLMDLNTGLYRTLLCNSSFTESYPTWSQNGRWIMFVSKRDDGVFSRPWFCHIDADGREAKPFVLPQKNPDFYNQWLLNYNRPEFISGKVEVTPGKIKQFITNHKAAAVRFDTSFHAEAITGATITR
jgi:hypothetical protein